MRVTVGGVAWVAINASDASIIFRADAIRAVGAASRMQSIIATFARV